jgi:hypothetical protein
MAKKKPLIPVAPMQNATISQAASDIMALVQVAQAALQTRRLGSQQETDEAALAVAKSAMQTARLLTVTIAMQVSESTRAAFKDLIEAGVPEDEEE